jgi:uncharacterized RDD family membrane protein YckC
LRFTSSNEKSFHNRAGFWLRLLAVFLDIVIFLLLTFVLAMIASMAMAIDEKVLEKVILLFLLLYTTMEVFFAGTPGKRILSLKIASSNNLPPDPWRRIVRWSSKQSPLILQFLFVTTKWPLFTLLAGFSATVVVAGSFFAANDDKQAWHDQWAGTAVYRGVVEQATGATIP